LPLGPPPLSTELRPVIRAWNMMGGQIDWSALPLIADLLGFDELDVLIGQLCALRDRNQQD
jgi:hypothetical protein